MAEAHSTQILLDRVESPLRLSNGRFVTSGFWITHVAGRPDLRGSGKSPAEALRRLADEMESLGSDDQG